MKASGWDEAIALDALETTMREHLAGVTRRPTRRARRRGRCRAADIAAGTPYVRAGDREVKRR